MESKRDSKRKLRVGIVSSNRMNKTVVVEVHRTFRHPVFKKVMRSSKKYVAHDESGNVGMGDLVEIAETRPLSKTKRWRVVKILEAARGKMPDDDGLKENGL